MARTKGKQCDPTSLEYTLFDTIHKLVNSYGHGHDYQTRCAKPALCVLPILLVTVREFFV